MAVINPIIDRCEALAAEGYSVSAVTIMRGRPGMLRVAISLATYLPLGEGGDLPHHVVRLNRDILPPGVTIGGLERAEDVVMDIPGGEEQAEALIRDVARVGLAQDWAQFGGPTPDYPHWLTKPNKWRKAAK